jgi:formylglycine-generating enzyme required for sulfatase activity
MANSPTLFFVSFAIFGFPFSVIPANAGIQKKSSKDLFLVIKKVRLLIQVFLLPSGETPMRRFEFSDSTSNKFWEVDVKGKTLNVTFGKIGTKGQSKPKDFATPEKAKAEMEKLIKEKTGKGYVEVGGKAVKKTKSVAKSVASKKSNPGSVGEGLSKALNKAWREEEDLGNGVSLEMILIPAGKFVMGSPKKEKGRWDDETQHEVTLTKSFYMGKYEVTQEQWEAVMGNNPSSGTKGAKLPVTDVSWKDCQKFIKKLNGITKGKYRLSTEAEWEYACRAGTSTAYSFGDKITPKDANYDDSGIGKPIEVGSYKPNAFGLYDMHGNVWEWCEDWKADYPKGAVIDPKGPAKGDCRVLRGGSFDYDESDARSSNRVNDAPTYRDSSDGFRLARTAL